MYDQNIILFKVSKLKTKPKLAVRCPSKSLTSDFIELIILP